MIKTKKEGTIIVLSGPSGAGKGTIVNEYLTLHPETMLSISMTTRSKRVNEISGKSYIFVSNEEFEERIKNKEFIEWAKYGDSYYGTPKKYIEDCINNGQDIILEIEVQGAEIIRKSLPEAICIFITPPDFRDLIKRLKNRGTEEPEKIIKRFKEAYREINSISHYNYVVLNKEDDLKSAVLDVEAIIRATKLRTDRLSELNLGTPEDIIHEMLQKEESND